ncbi:MAG: ABC transporter ATP-binding protein/permease [Clostridia bacterium]|nr:ABC transporter ATP-binding protein/permease [Clostridia bacterium]
MLELKQIVKEYGSGENIVRALDGIDIAFRANEFVAILGHSGCGKTTLLNLIGGLDHYTSGDLIIRGTSPREYSDRDWDAYRNHSVGFVFQSYNLIPHQTVLANVELALTISGVSRAERRRRAKEALEKVGLGDQLHKKPGQMSGGQMQRVAIARALVNDPDILLADEPTGALDTDTSVQIMEILREIAQDKLIIMVTHNPELAEAYATRIVRIRDGRLTDDSHPYAPEAEEAKPAADPAAKHVSMSFFTAISLSLNNLMTKKGRTVLTAFAGSIGIIGIALILALSTGINTYINQVQEDTLSSYPITIEAERVDMTEMMTSMMGVGASHAEGAAAYEEGRVYSSTVMYEMMNAMMNTETAKNNLRDFKVWLDSEDNPVAELATVRYGYDAKFDIYTRDEDGGIVKSDVMALMEEAMGAMFGGDYSSYFSTMGSMYQQMNVWEELLPGENGELIAEQVYGQYDLLHGRWPEAHDEVILFVDAHNQISDLMLYALGFISSDAMSESMQAMMNGGEMEIEQLSWSYDELCATEFKLILPAEHYVRDAGSGQYVHMSDTAAGLEFLYNNDEIGTPLTVVGIARPNPDAAANMVTGAIGYLSTLTTHVIDRTEGLDVVQAQLADADTDVFTGLPFADEDTPEPTADEKRQAITGHIATLGNAEKAAIYLDLMRKPSYEYVAGVVAGQMQGLDRAAIEAMIMQQYAAQMGVDAETIKGYIAKMDDATLFAQVEQAMAEQVAAQYAAGVEAQLGAMTIDMQAAALDGMLSAGSLREAQYDDLYENHMPPTSVEGSAEENLDLLGYVDMDSPSTVSIYATTFAEKDEIAALIDEYNAGVDEDDQITYTDYVALLMSAVTDIISGVSYLLIAFVAISLVVSSIMIGIITYISVLERTREIGILRAIGASKRDVSNVFNAETLIVGFLSGAIGIGVSVLLCFPINAIIHHLTNLDTLRAAVPPAGGIALVVISMALTLIAGVIPSRMAARKDPVEALRSE